MTNNHLYTAMLDRRHERILEKMGKLIAKTQCDKIKIWKHIIMRILVTAVVIFMLFLANTTTNNPVEGTRYFTVGIIILLLFYTLIPIRHMRDCLEFYENGIKLNNKEIIFEPGVRISWYLSKTYFFGNRNKILFSNGKKTKTLDVTYLASPKDMYISAYHEK